MVTIRPAGFVKVPYFGQTVTLFCIPGKQKTPADVSNKAYRQASEFVAQTGEPALSIDFDPQTKRATVITGYADVMQFFRDGFALAEKQQTQQQAIGQGSQSFDNISVSASINPAASTPVKTRFSEKFFTGLTYFLQPWRLLEFLNSSQSSPHTPPETFIHEPFGYKTTIPGVLSRSLKNVNLQTLLESLEFYSQDKQTPESDPTPPSPNPPSPNGSHLKLVE